MLNREIKVDIVKKNPQEVFQPELPFEKKTEAISDVIEKTTWNIVKGVIAYIAADTIRKLILKGRV